MCGNAYEGMQSLWEILALDSKLKEENHSKITLRGRLSRFIQVATSAAEC